MASFAPIRRIHKMLPPSGTRLVWTSLIIIGFCVSGFLVFLAINFTEGPDHHEDWLISLVFLSAATFIFIVCILSHSTAKDVSRIASLELAASIDPVTNTYNRLHIRALLDTECSRSSRNRTPVSVLLLDIDRFKMVNDTYGHAAGDLVLQRLGGLLQESVEGSRYIGRYGGDEFLIILPNTASSLAFSGAERIRALAEETSISYALEALTPVTISIGVRRDLDGRRLRKIW
jgi:diguanylate cyclase (GGDEF)-like protein